MARSTATTVRSSASASATDTNNVACVSRRGRREPSRIRADRPCRRRVHARVQLRRRGGAALRRGRELRRVHEGRACRPVVNRRRLRPLRSASSHPSLRPSLLLPPSATRFSSRSTRPAGVVSVPIRTDASRDCDDMALRPSRADIRRVPRGLGARPIAGRAGLHHRRHLRPHRRDERLLRRDRLQLADVRGRHGREHVGAAPARLARPAARPPVRERAASTSCAPR